MSERGREREAGGGEGERERERERHYMLPKTTEWKVKNNQIFGIFSCMLVNIEIFANTHVLDGN